MHIYVNVGENLVDTFERITTLFKSSPKNLFVGNKMVDINVTVKSPDNSADKVDENIFMFKGGKLIDCRKALIDVAVRRCFAEAKKELKDKLAIIPNTYEEEIVKLNEEIDKLQVRVERTTSENVKKKSQRAILSKQEELSQISLKKEEEQKSFDFFKKIDTCIQEGKVNYNAVVACSKDTNVIKDVYARIIIDEDCTVFSMPVYFIKEFSYEKEEDCMLWYSLKENTDMIDMVSLI